MTKEEYNARFTSLLGLKGEKVFVHLPGGKLEIAQVRVSRDSSRIRLGPMFLYMHCDCGLCTYNMLRIELTQVDESDLWE